MMKSPANPFIPPLTNQGCSQQWGRKVHPQKLRSIARLTLGVLLPLPLGLARSGMALEVPTNPATVPVIPTVQVAPSLPPAQVGIEFESSPTLNQTSLIQPWVNHETVYQETGVEYRRAYCPSGRRHRRTPYSVYGPTVLVSSNPVTPYRQGQPRVTAFFVSSQTPPAPGLRVVLQNRSISGATLPFTDREYDDSRRSEKFFVSPANEHNSKYLAMIPGENRLTYEIKRGNQVLESGEFRVSLEVQDRYVTRTITRPREVIEIPCPAKDHDDKHDRRRRDRR